MTKRVLLITDSQERTLITESILARADCVISAKLSYKDDWFRDIGESDAVFFALEKSTPEILNGIRRITYERPTPVVMFVDQGDEASVEAAIQAGVSAYVVDGLSPTRIKPIVEVAIVRFQQLRKLQTELDTTKHKLSQRKVIDQAKGIIMNKRGITEDQAYKVLRKMAMDKSTSMIEVARNVIDVAEMLS